MQRKLIGLFALLPAVCLADITDVSAILDGEEATANTTITSTIMNNMIHSDSSWPTGSGAGWSVSSSRVKISGNNKPTIGQFRVNGTVYPNGSQTRGIKVDPFGSNNSYLHYNLPSENLRKDVSIGFWFYMPTPNAIVQNWPDIVHFEAGGGSGGGGWAVAQVEDLAGKPKVKMHTGDSGYNTTDGNNIVFDYEKWHWITFKAARNKACELKIYNDGGTLLGTSRVNPGISSGWKWVRIGRCDAHGSISFNGPALFENIVFDFADATFPLGPGTGTAPGPDQTPPVLNAATIVSTGNSLDLQFSEGVQVGTGGNAGWVAAMSGGPVTMTYASGFGSSTLRYNLSRTIDRTETGAITYSQPGNGVEDQGGGNDLVNISAFNLTNNSTANLLPQPVHPINTDVVAATGGSLIEGWLVEGGTISQAATTFDPTGSERASFKFDVPVDGDYVISCLVEAPDTASDSFFVTILSSDGEPTTDHQWAIQPPTSGGPEARNVSWWGNGPPAEFDPKVWTLAAGEHEVIFRGRENGAVLHSLSLASHGSPELPPPPPPKNLRVINAPIINAPIITSATLPSGGITLELDFSEPVGFGAGGSGGVTVSMSGGASTATYYSGAGTSTLVYSLSRTIGGGEAGTLGYGQPGNGIEATNDRIGLASFSGRAIVNNVGGPVSAPSITSATVPSGGTRLHLNFSESVEFGAGGNGGVTLNMSGGASVAAYSSGAGTATLVYSLARTIGESETGTVAYTQPTDGVRASDDQAEVVAFSGLAVVNSAGNPSAADLLPDDRMVDWSLTGVVQKDGTLGIPQRTQLCNSAACQDLLNLGDSGSNQYSRIQNAINSAQSGEVVFIPEGNYTVGGTLDISRDDITIRGAGTDKTVITRTGSGNIFDFVGSGSIGGNTRVSVKSGFGKGSSEIVIGSGSAGAFKAGTVVLMDQQNETIIENGDPIITVTPNGLADGGRTQTCSWCGPQSTSRSYAETAIVVSKAQLPNGDYSLTLNRPLYYDFKASKNPILNKISDNPVSRSGIEDLAINHSSSGDGVYFEHAVYCWAKNIDVGGIRDKNIVVKYGTYGVTIQSCYIHDSDDFSSDNGYGIEVSGWSSGHRIEDNTLNNTHNGIIFDAMGSSGCVVSYNYVHNTRHFETDFLIRHFGTHGAHSHMNLFEGNVGGKLLFDSYWGSGSHNIAFRNHLRGANAQAVGGLDPYQGLHAVAIDALNWSCSVIGNVLGTGSTQGGLEIIPVPNIYSSNPSSRTLWKIGLAQADSGNPIDPNVKLSLIRHSNYDFVTNSVVRPGSQALPHSLYLSQKPNWWGSAAWPPIGPDLPNMLTPIPAQSRFAASSP